MRREITYLRGNVEYKTSYKIKPNPYKFAHGSPEKSELGSGGFGKVYLVKNEINELYALKIFKKGESEDQDEFRRITTHGHKESDIIKQIQETFSDDPFMQRSLPRLHDAFYDEKNVFHQVTDYIKGSQLDKCLMKTKDFSLEKKKEMVFTLLYIIGKLHQKGFLHRDIKPGNVMIRHRSNEFDLNKANIWKNTVVIDLGFACKFDECDIDTKGTLRYMSSDLLYGKCIEYEVENDKSFVWEKADVWAVGVSIYQIVFSLENKCLYPFSSILKDKEQRKKDILLQITNGTKKLQKSGDYAIDSIIHDILIIGAKKENRPSISKIIETYKDGLTVENGSVYILAVEKKNSDNAWFGSGSSSCYNVNGVQWKKNQKEAFSLDHSRFESYLFKICVNENHPVYITNDLSGEFNMPNRKPAHKIFGSILQQREKKDYEIRPIDAGIVKFDMNETNEKQLYIQCGNHSKMGVKFGLIDEKEQSDSQEIPQETIRTKVIPTFENVIGKLPKELNPKGDIFICEINGRESLWSCTNREPSRNIVKPICKKGHDYGKNELVEWISNFCKNPDQICYKCVSE